MFYKSIDGIAFATRVGARALVNMLDISRGEDATLGRGAASGSCRNDIGRRTPLVGVFAHAHQGRSGWIDETIPAEVAWGLGWWATAIWSLASGGRLGDGEGLWRAQLRAPQALYSSPRRSSGCGADQRPKIFFPSHPPARDPLIPPPIPPMRPPMAVPTPGKIAVPSAAPPKAPPKAPPEPPTFCTVFSPY